jgi:hypothetical protein
MNVLIVAHRTAATPRLLDAVREKAASDADTRFTLLVPRDYWDPDTERAAMIVELAVPVLSDAAGSHVEAVIGDSDPYVATRDELDVGSYDEVIVSTLPHRVSHWLHRDLPSRVEKLGYPVTLVTAAGRDERAVPPVA